MTAPLAQIALRNDCLLIVRGRVGTATLDAEIHGHATGWPCAMFDIGPDTSVMAWQDSEHDIVRLSIGDVVLYPQTPACDARALANKLHAHFADQRDPADADALDLLYGERLADIPAPDMTPVATPCPPGATPRNIALDERKGART